jgi:outer membrane protein
MPNRNRPPLRGHDTGLVGHIAGCWAPPAGGETPVSYGGRCRGATPVAGWQRHARWCWVPALLSICVWGALACRPSAAAEAESQAWTLESCIRTALEQHGDILSARENVNAAEAQKRSAASSLFYPKLSLQSTHTEGYTETDRQGTDRSSQQNLLRLGVTFWDGGVQRQNVRRARAGEESAQAALDRTRQGLVYQVTSAYLELLRAQHAQAVAERKLSQAEAQKVMVEARIKAGAAAEVEIYPIEVEIANARVEKIRAANDVRVAGSALRNAMGIGPGGVPEITDLPAEIADAPALEACLEEAAGRRPEIRQAKAALEQQQAGLDLARLNLRPLINVGGGLDRGFAGTYNPNQWSLSATLSWSLYDRADRAQVDAARATLRSAEEQLQQVTRDIAAEVEQAHLALTSARERIAAAEASVAMARKNLEVAEARYKQGLAIPIEIVDAQVAFSNAELQAISARYDYLLARTQLDRAIGSL